MPRARGAGRGSVSTPGATTAVVLVGDNPRRFVLRYHQVPRHGGKPVPVEGPRPRIPGPAPLHDPPLQRSQLERAQPDPGLRHCIAGAECQLAAEHRTAAVRTGDRVRPGRPSGQRPGRTVGCRHPGQLGRDGQRIDGVVGEGHPKPPVGGERVPDDDAETLRRGVSELRLVHVGRQRRLRPGHLDPTDHGRHPAPTGQVAGRARSRPDRLDRTVGPQRHDAAAQPVGQPRRWHRPHQNRFRPASSSVRTLDPQTQHGIPVRR